MAGTMEKAGKQMEMTLALEIMYHRFSRENLKRHTGALCKEYHMDRKEYEEYVREGMRQETEMLKQKRRVANDQLDKTTIL